MFVGLRSPHYKHYNVTLVHDTVCIYYYAVLSLTVFYSFFHNDHSNTY